MKKNKKLINQILVAIISANALIFLLLAYFDKLSTDPKDLVFIDFLGRLTVYYLCFTAYEFSLEYMNENEEKPSPIKTSISINRDRQNKD